jgi:hypothetical protein
MIDQSLLDATRRPLDPRICNIAVDANALDRGGTARDRLVERFCGLSHARRLRVVLAGGVRDEVEHPRTPEDVKAILRPQIFNLRPGLTTSQRADHRRVQTILTGNAHPQTHAADASHLSEAAETGCGYFVTEDKRILKKRTQLHAALPPTLTIVNLVEFFEIFDDYEAGRRK